MWCVGGTGQRMLALAATQRLSYFMNEIKIARAARL
jgi:hypothetical protein